LPRCVVTLGLLAILLQLFLAMARRQRIHDLLQRFDDRHVEKHSAPHAKKPS
jgi:hypothetical protein